MTLERLFREFRDLIGRDALGPVQGSEVVVRYLDQEYEIDAIRMEGNTPGTQVVVIRIEPDGER